MKRRSNVGTAPARAQRLKAAKRKRHRLKSATAPKADKNDAIARLTGERDEAREQQAANSEVLQIISGSPSELEQVFQAVLKNATRLCGAKFGTLYLSEGDCFRLGALHNPPSAFAEDRRREPVLRAAPGTALARLRETRKLVQIADIQSEPAYRRDRRTVANITLAGYRTVLAIPMLKRDNLIGAVMIARQEVRPFTDKQIELVKNFAAQAVVAIENARLLNELRQRTTDLTERTADLTEALEQQTATSEVFRVISSSPGDLEPVFASMLEKAVRICDATFGNIFRWDGGSPSHSGDT
jgi:GAF domain-containing protein